MKEASEIVPFDSRTNAEPASRNGHDSAPERAAWLPWVGATVLGAGLAGLWSVLVEPRWLEVTRREVALPRLPPALDGLRIAHLSDFHLSPSVSTAFLHHCVRTATREQPDLALITGDYGTRSGRSMAHVTPVLSGLRARQGVFAILGNHDHAASPDKVERAIEVAGVRCLRNEAVRLRSCGEDLWLVGIDSLHTRQYQVPKRLYRAVTRKMQAYLRHSLQDVDPNAFRILLAHSPDIIPDAREAQIDLVLSGHTHGGQVRFPIVGATVCPSRFGTRYAAGLYREGDTALYVTRGLGTVRLPIRFLCRPELAILTLRAGH
jgi:predicted MPP superfamily phosphohydrolase